MRSISPLRSLLSVLVVPALWICSPSLLAQEPEALPQLIPANELVESADEVNLIEEGRTTNQAQLWIELITQRFPHRLTGSPHLKMAQMWVLESFEGWDVEARLEQWGEVEVGFERSVSKGTLLGKTPLELQFTTPAWSAGTDGISRGKVMIELESFEQLEQRKEEYKGAWVLRNPAVSRREGAKRTELMTEVGAAGYIQPGSRDGRLITGGSRNITWDKLPRLPRVTLLYEQFESLLKSVGAGEQKELEFEIHNQFLHGPIPQHNVIVDIKGTQWPDEYVIVQGHIDGWDGAQGACDNGTGVSTTMSAAHMLLANGIKPKRTIRFIFYSGEEQGLLGSRGFVDLHVDELDKISVVLNHDNGTNYLSGIQATAAMLEDFQHVFAPIMKLDPARPFKIHEVDGLKGGSSDHASFLAVGVPGFHWEQSHEGYRRLHHTQYDTIEEVNHEDQRHSSLVVALAALRFANLDHLIDRTMMREPAPRRMGVFLAGDKQTIVGSVSPGGMAAAAGWQEGDLIVSINGVAVDSRSSIVEQLGMAGAAKTFVLKRAEEEVESVLDWSEDPEEAERSAWAAHKAALPAEHEPEPAPASESEPKKE